MLIPPGCAILVTINCRISTNESQLEAIGRTIRRYYSTRFSPLDILIVTWDEVGHYAEGSEQV